MSVSRLIGSVTVILGLLMAAGGSAWAEAGPPALERFFGRFDGTTVSDIAGEINVRDIGVEIRPRPRGFNVTWMTSITKDDGKVKHLSQSIDFAPTRRPGIFASEMAPDMFGHRVPMDPLKGEPFYWARVRGDTLTVYAFRITDQGGFATAVWERRLTAEGMDLMFTRSRDHEPVRRVEGRLQRVE